MNRLKAAVAAAVLAGSLAGPTVLSASAATHQAQLSRRQVAAIRAAALRAHDLENPIVEIIQEIELDVSPANIESILQDFPGFPPYGTL